MEYLILWHLSSPLCAKLNKFYSTSTEISPAFRKHLVDKDFFMHGDKNIFSSYVQLLADLSFLEFSTPLPLKNPTNTFPFPNVVFAVAVHLDKPKTTDF